MEICVNVFQLIQNVNMSLEICANVFGSLMDPYKDPPWIRIWILYGSLCGSYMGRLYVNVFTSDPKCQYSIGNMSKCVRGTLGGRGGTSGQVRGHFGPGSGSPRGHFRERFETAGGSQRQTPLWEFSMGLL